MTPRLLVQDLADEVQAATEAGYRAIPVTIRVSKPDGSVQDIDATAIKYHPNSGLVYIHAKET